jgi:catechol 2,3-dioxygenase-like lactoylglutathione lyase family enzyme
VRIGITELFVDDQDKALRFYTETLGFRVKTDAAYGATDRWLTVVSPEQPDGPELLLAPMTGAARSLQSDRRARGSPAISFTTDDCQREFDDLSSRGVTFHRRPERLAYGGIDAVLDDGCGNLVNLHQEAE